jgi:hypothetical protein
MGTGLCGLRSVTGRLLLPRVSGTRLPGNGVGTPLVSADRQAFQP